jgi:hypothetical protein
VSTFAERVCKSARAAYIDQNDETIKARAFEHFKNKVRPQLALHIRTKDCKSMDEAIRATAELEAFLQAQAMRDSQWRHDQNSMTGQFSNISLSNRTNFVTNSARVSSSRQVRSNWNSDGRRPIAYISSSDEDEGTRRRENSPEFSGNRERGYQRNWSRDNNFRHRRHYSQSNHDRRQDSSSDESDSNNYRRRHNNW